MIHTFVFGTPVRTSDHDLGKLERIIVNNGIANQITVNPGLLQTERVVPVSDIQTAAADVIQLHIGEAEWKAYTGFHMERALSTPSEDSPNLAVYTPISAAAGEIRDSSHPTTMTGAREVDDTVDNLSVVLTSSTIIGGAGVTGNVHLKGIVTDTGRPQQLILSDDRAIPYETVTQLDERHIELGTPHAQPLLDADRGYESTTVNDPAGDERR